MHTTHNNVRCNATSVPKLCSHGTIKNHHTSPVLVRKSYTQLEKGTKILKQHFVSNSNRQAHTKILMVIKV